MRTVATVAHREEKVGCIDDGRHRLKLKAGRLLGVLEGRWGVWWALEN